MSASITGYVLAGGRSSRMGTDKAMLQLAGKPLIQRAVETLSAVCQPVYILSSNPQLAPHATLVADIHPGCGPLAGIEAALLHTTTDWNLFLAVDMPFVPAAFLSEWISEIIPIQTARVALFHVDGYPQPTLSLIHRQLAPFVQQSIARNELKIVPLLEEASRLLATRQGVSLDEVLLARPATDPAWFANLNTPEQFAEAERAFVTGL